MAVRKRKTQKKKQTHGSRIILKIIAVITAALLLFIGYAALNANIVHVRYAQITVRDLPAVFDGTKLLFVSDIDLCGINSPEKSAKLFERLQAIKPDILLLGGDYTSASVMDTLNQTDSSAKEKERREAFFRSIEDFRAPLGKFAVAGENDTDVSALRDILEETGIRPLFNDHAVISKNGGKIHLVGFCANTSGVNFNAVGNAFRQDDCVISLSHSPASFPHILTAEAKDSGNWADIMLAGHTHGGQIRLMDNNIIPLTTQEQSFLYGWKKERDTRILTTSGLGCEGVNLRVGTGSEVWVITLSDGIANLPDLTL
jgi:predicted MPP superfamily phosphohydrolase